MRTSAMIAGLVFAASALADRPSDAKARERTDPAPVTYRAHCGMVYTAAEAKKDHYVCPMDHLKMVPIRAAGARSDLRGNQ